ncbi:MAG: hypothetical protein LUD82_05310 [Clostridiales bacterium]|nr:hypothetical protein [Clostridiales bacterium]
MANAVGKKVGCDLTSGPIMPSLLSFALPIVITDVIQQLYSMVDLMVIGQFVGNVGTVGVNTGGEIADFLMPVATAFAAAGQIYVAQLAGARKYEEQKRAIGTFISLMLCAALGFMVLTIALTNPILNLLNCPEESLSEARNYMIITAVGLPFIYGYNAVCGVLRGMGESQRPPGVHHHCGCGEYLPGYSAGGRVPAQRRRYGAGYSVLPGGGVLCLLCIYV